MLNYKIYLEQIMEMISKTPCVLLPSKDGSLFLEFLGQKTKQLQSNCLPHKCGSLILFSVSRIENSTKNVSIEELADNKDLWDSTLLRLQVIGESIKSIPYEIKKRNKQVKWKIFSKLRNFISHKYIQVNKEIIWNIIKKQIPELKKELQGVK